ncbi:MAG: hypothetical protein ABJD07_02925 [Gemmatimonadaceae bacterium]
MGALIALAIAGLLALFTTGDSDASAQRARSERAYTAIRVEMDSTHREFQLSVWRARYGFLFDDSVRTRREIDSLVSRLGHLEALRDSLRARSRDTTPAGNPPR